MKTLRALGLGCVAATLGSVSLISMAPTSCVTAAEDAQQAATPRLVRDSELTDEQLRTKVAELRRKLPYESVSHRLEHESRRPKSAPRLSEDSAHRLDELEKAYEGEHSYHKVRAQSLAALHSDKVLEFMRQEGMGLSRMVRIEPGPSYLELPRPELIPLAKPSSADERPGPTIVLPKKEIAEYGLQSWSPSVAMLLGFHDQSQNAFVDFWGLGHIKDRNHVAGFMGHGFRYNPQLLHPKQAELPPNQQPKLDQWKVGRLELIGLLTHETPQAYVSEHLPKMEELAKVKTRDLNSFEARALKSLAAGDDLVTDAHANRIDMMGAIRAVKQCQECHEVKRGALLGAFTYDLFRDPPIAVGSVPPTPET